MIRAASAARLALCWQLGQLLNRAGKGRNSVVLNSIFGGFSADLAIDLGTANTLIYVKGEWPLERPPGCRWRPRRSINSESSMLIPTARKARSTTVRMLSPRSALIIATCRRTLAGTMI